MKTSKLKTLEKARKILGLSHKQMAELVGVSRCFYTQIENGTRRPSLDVAIRISNVLGIPVNSIFASTNVVSDNVARTGTDSR